VISAALGRRTGELRHNSRTDALLINLPTIERESMMPATSPRRIAVLCLAAAAIAAGGVSVSGASADAPSLQDQIDHQLAVTQGGVQTGPNEVSYQGGRVVMTFPMPGSARALDIEGCPEGLSVKWYCFYEKPDFGGRKLQFNDCSSEGVTQYFANFNFTAMTSSWANTKNGGVIYVFNGNTRLWTEHPNSKDARLGANDNHATYFTCHS
jgi:hypothetical protein